VLVPLDFVWNLNGRCALGVAVVIYTPHCATRSTIVDLVMAIFTHWSCSLTCKVYNRRLATKEYMDGIVCLDLHVHKDIFLPKVILPCVFLFSSHWWPPFAGLSAIQSRSMNSVRILGD